MGGLRANRARSLSDPALKLLHVLILHRIRSAFFKTKSSYFLLKNYEPTPHQYIRNSKSADFIDVNRSFSLSMMSAQMKKRFEFIAGDSLKIIIDIQHVTLSIEYIRLSIFLLKIFPHVHFLRVLIFTPAHEIILDS